MSLMKTLLFLLSAGLAFSASQNTLTVQVVGPDWLPIPTTDVRVTNVEDCSAQAAAVFPTVSRTTDRSGRVSFEIAGTGRYRIEVPRQDGITGTSRCVRLANFNSDCSVAYVQIQLRLAGPTVTVKD
jgi:hypothetical protein